MYKLTASQQRDPSNSDRPIISNIFHAYAETRMTARELLVAAWKGHNVMYADCVGEAIQLKPEQIKCGALEVWIQPIEGAEVRVYALWEV